jgi:hypothetical protein
MKALFCAAMLLIIMVGSCTTYRSSLVVKGRRNEAIQNAIIIFLHSGGKLMKKDTVFSIHTKGFGDTLIGVDIFGQNNKLLPGPQTKIGTNQPGFPTNYIEKNGKLFYWYDEQGVITPDLVAMLSKYKRIDSLNVNGFVGIPKHSIDESKKGTNYFFCTCDLRKYKRDRSSIGLSAPLPNLKCSCH